MRTHEDQEFCLECGETILTVDLTKPQLLSANGSQYQVSQRARAARRHAKNDLKRRGWITARNHIATHPGFQPFEWFDVTYLVRYPTRKAADADNLLPTVKPFIDGCTAAGLWPDDSSRYMRARTYLQSTRTSGRKGLWTIEIHITPLPKEEP